jgi:hypothetical protein
MLPHSRPLYDPQLFSKKKHPLLIRLTPTIETQIGDPFGGLDHAQARVTHPKKRDVSNNATQQEEANRTPPSPSHTGRPPPYLPSVEAAPPASLPAGGNLPAPALTTRVNKTVDDRFPQFNKNRPVNRSNRPVYRACEFIGTILGWDPNRFVYRAGPVPPGTGRTGPVPTGLRTLLTTLPLLSPSSLHLWRSPCGTRASLLHRPLPGEIPAAAILLHYR